MIILIEPDKEIRKNLADLVSRERLIGVDSIQQCLQMILKYKNDLDLIVANVNLLSEMLSKHIIERVCQRLNIGLPPVIGIFKHGEEDAKHAFMSQHRTYKVIEYADKDLGFPNRYLEVIQKACPELVIDYERARETWLKIQQPQELVDPRQWLEEEGFLEAQPAQSTEQENPEKDEDVITSIQALLNEEETDTTEPPEEKAPAEREQDYKTMYTELKKKYDELLKSVRAFMESVSKNST
jgi:signal recognition particle subunit SEC65